MKFARKADFYKNRLAAYVSEALNRIFQERQYVSRLVFRFWIFALGQECGISEVYVSIEANVKTSY